MFAGQAIDPKLAAIAPFLDPKEMYSAMKPKEADKPQLVTVYGDDGKPVQKWLRPGEADGVQVGMGKPDTGNMSSVGQMISERDKLPPGHPARRVYDDAIRKQTTHAPAAQMNNYGTSFTAAVDKNGNPVLLQPSKGGGQPNVVEGYMPSDDAAKARQAASASTKSVSALDILERDIKALKTAPGLPYAVGLYSHAPVVGGTSQADAVAQIENLASRAAVGALNEMREMSKTGGAVGAVTEKEWPKLEAQLANLNRKQGHPQFLKSLEAFENQVRESKRLIREAQSKQPGINRPAANDDPLGLRN
jgi:hypothetical protein